MLRRVPPYEACGGAMGFSPWGSTLNLLVGAGSFLASMQKPSQNGRQQAKDSLSNRTKNRYSFCLGLLFPIDIRRPCKYNSSLGSGLALTHSVRKDPRRYIARPNLLHFFLNSVGLDLSFISSLPCPRSLALRCCCK
jgi:hypothetical protein